jgi:hypothetical protein
MTGFQPFDYALREHAGETVGFAFWKAAIYAAGGIAYVALPAVVLWLATRAHPRTLANTLWPSQPPLRMLAVLLWVPLLLPMVTAPLFGGVLTPLWTMQGWFLLPILLLAPAAVVLHRAAAIKVCAGLLIVTAALLAVAPVLAFARHSPVGKDLFRVEEYRLTRQAVAHRITAIWREATGRPLTIVAGGVGGNRNFASYAVTFYSPEHPDSVVTYDQSVVGYDLSASPWVTPERLRREGWLALCMKDEDKCIVRTQQFAGGRPLKTVEFDVIVTFWGWSRDPVHYVAYLALPEN